MPIVHPLKQQSASLNMRGWVHLGQAHTRLDIALPSLLELMHNAGLADPWGHPSGVAHKRESARWMQAQQQYLWRLEDLAPLVRQARSGGFPNWGRETVPAQDSIRRRTPFVALHRIGQTFGRSAIEVGSEFKRMGWRARNGMPTAYVLGKGIARMEVSHSGRIRVHWDLEQATQALQERGWELPTPNPPTRTWPRPAKVL